MRQLTIRLPDELWNRVDEEARRNGTSMAGYLRDAATAHIHYMRGVSDSGITDRLTALEDRVGAVERQLREHAS